MWRIRVDHHFVFDTGFVQGLVEGCDGFWGDAGVGPSHEGEDGGVDLRDKLDGSPGALRALTVGTAVEPDGTGEAVAVGRLLPGTRASKAKSEREYAAIRVGLAQAGNRRRDVGGHAFMRYERDVFLMRELIVTVADARRTAEVVDGDGVVPGFGEPHGQFLVEVVEAADVGQNHDAGGAPAFGEGLVNGELVAVGGRERAPMVVGSGSGDRRDGRSRVGVKAHRLFLAGTGAESQAGAGVASAGPAQAPWQPEHLELADRSRELWLQMPAPIDQAAVADLVRPFGRSRSLPAEAFRSRELFEWEIEHIFSGGWICLGRTADLLAPGQLRAISHGAETVLLARDSGGVVHAFSNVCRHRGHPLLEVGDPIDARLIRCPYHAWSYRFDGTLRSAPSLTTSPEFDPSNWPLTSIRVDEWAGWLFMDLSGTANGLEATFGNLAGYLAPYEPERLVKVARHSYEIAANWKLVVENYHECYHCTSIHPELCQVTPPTSGEDVVPEGLWCGGTMTLKDHAVTMSLTGQSQGINFRNLPPGRERNVLYLGLWPNLLVSPHPDYVMTHRLVPVAPDRTQIECDWLFPPEALVLEGFDPAYAVDFWDITNREDWTACSNVQKGTANRGFCPGPLSPWETTIYQFHHMLGAAYLGQETSAPVPRRPDLIATLA